MSDLPEFSSYPQPKTTGQPAWLQAIRWIATLPAAIFGSLIAYWAIRLVMWLGSSRFGDESWLEYFWNEIVSSGLMGAAFIFCAAYVAPRFKRQTAIVFAGLLLSLSGLLLVAAFSTEQYMSVLATICMNGGAIITAIAIFTGELEAG
jgi:hypothetical protein